MTMHQCSRTPDEVMMLFLSHAWEPDELKRDTHNRCRALAKELKDLGWSVWLDEERIVGSIDACIAAGVDECTAFVVLLTRAYANKLERASRSSRCREACLCEWTYAHTARKVVVPVVFEPCMRDTSSWPGVVALHLGNTLYVDGVGDDLAVVAAALDSRLRAYASIGSPSPRRRSQVLLPPICGATLRSSLARTPLPSLPPIVTTPRRATSCDLTSGVRHRVAQFVRRRSR
jgi:hypothetical protein